MELRPVKQYAPPAFPTKTEINASPEVLRMLPKRWQQHAVLGSLLAGIGFVAMPRLLHAEVDPQANPIAARVAPIFPYPGMLERIAIAGGIGFMPQFLAEEEARKIINEEAAKAGLTFEADVRTIDKVPLTAVREVDEGRISVIKAPILLDGIDTKHRIGYEFVSQTDIEEWQKAGITPVNDMSNHAAMLREGLTQAMPEGATAVFYDPSSMPLQGVDLRQQVREFIAWLKAEGVI